MAETFKDVDSTIKIDSFRFVRYKTLTLQDKYSAMVQNITDEMNELNSEMAEHLDLYKKEAQQLSLLKDLRSYFTANVKGICAVGN